jgi:long-chain acyl-CoA synthetase
MECEPADDGISACVHNQVGMMPGTRIDPPPVRATRSPQLPKWPRWRPVRWLGYLLLRLVGFPILWLGYSLTVRGGDRLERIDRPCLIVSNHNMHLDQSLLLKSMPGHMRRRVAIAAAESDIFGNRLRGFWAAFIGNAFPFANRGMAVRGSLDNVVAMLDQGWNVLMFPEGKLTVGGPMQPFRPGIARLASETGVPVVPMRIDVLRPGFYEGRWLPHPRARVRVSIGEPVSVPECADLAVETLRLQRAVAEA